MIAKPTDFSDPDAYMKLLTIWHNQQNQDAENAKNHDTYATDYTSWMVRNTQSQANGGAIDPPLTMPQRRQYNDDGTVTLTPFTDLKPTVLPPLSVNSTPLTGLVPKGTQVQMTIDQKLDAILMLLNSLVK